MTTTYLLLGYFFSFLTVAAYVITYFYESGGSWRLSVAGMVMNGIGFSFFYIFLEMPVEALDLSVKHYALATIAWIAGVLTVFFLRDKKR